MICVAIMNAKGGVGKSTLTMALAETLSIFFGKRVLVIDADGQMSVSLMLMPVAAVGQFEAQGKSLVGWASDAVLSMRPADPWGYVASNVSDVDDARSVYLLSGAMDLPLLERELSTRNRVTHFRSAFRALLDHVKNEIDVVLIDCAPGLSIVTECMLRDAAFHIVPVKPDLLAISGIQYVRRFKERDQALGFAHHLGTVINMVDDSSEIDLAIERLLRENANFMCFSNSVPKILHIQKAAIFSAESRSFQNKYPARAGTGIRALAGEVIARAASFSQPV